MVEYTASLLATLLIEGQTCEEGAINRFAVVENHGGANLVYASGAKVRRDRKALVDVFQISALEVSASVRLVTHQERELRFPSPGLSGNGSTHRHVSECKLEDFGVVHVQTI
jgi:hypothetical protein